MESNLKAGVRAQVIFMGRTPGGCRLVIHGLLDEGRDIFHFMQLFDEDAMRTFYKKFKDEIHRICAEDEFMCGCAGWCELTKGALERTLMLIEDEIKNDYH